MDGLVLSTELYPFRVSQKKRESWDLQFTIRNESNQTKMVSVEIDLPSVATFSKVGLVKKYEKQFDKFKPGQEMRFKEPIHQSSQTETGNHSAWIRIAEHMNEYGYESKTIKKEILLRIVP